MQDLTFSEVEEVSGGRMWWLAVAQMASDFYDGFRDGWEANQRADMK